MIGLSIKETQKKLRNKEINLLEVVDQYIDNQQDLNVFITTTFDKARDFAKKNIDNESYLQKPLAGVIMGYKDLFCTKGIKTTAGSKMLENFIPEYESTVTKMLNSAGVISIGKLNMDEFAMGSTNANSYFGTCYSPLRRIGENEKKLIPGGSSGGSAAAVAANMVMAATGSDTGGSIRQPASFCGLVGVKPRYGRCSRYGMIAFASSLDQAGVLAKNVEDAAIVLQEMSGFDSKDSTSLNIKPPNYTANLDASIKGKKIGIIKELDSFNLPNYIMKNYLHTQEILKSNGVEIKEVYLPHIKDSLCVYYIIAPAEAASNLSRYDGVRYTYCAKNPENLEQLYYKTRTQGFGEEVKLRILMGNYVLSSGYYDAYYLKAQKLRTIIANEFKQVLNDVDAIMTPTTPNVAFPIDEAPSNPVDMYLNDILTVSANIAGVAGISIPCGVGDYGLPVGMQLMGMKEDVLFNYAYKIENCHKGMEGGDE